MAVDADIASERHEAAEARGSLLYDPKVRGFFYQALLVLVIGAAVWFVVDNTLANLRQRNIASGYGFLSTHAGFDLSFFIIDFPKTATYGRAILVGLANTLLVAGIGIALATLIGFVVGVARLSPNWVVSRLATGYVEIIRNIPLLLQIFFWYFAVLQVLPQPRNSVALLPGAVFVNNRGLFLPSATFGEATGWAITLAVVVAIVVALLVWRWARTRQAATGQQFPVGLTALGLIFGLPLVAFLTTGAEVSTSFPQLRGFNFVGGTRVVPEFVALLVALSVYTAAFIAEIVRAGILAVSWGQSEAAGALGLRSGPTLRLVVIPQAMRVIIPPLTSQYLNLTKNSSLAVAIGYPDLVYVGGTVLNQTGQAIEIIAIWMAVYLGISVATSSLMNWYNRRMALVER